MKKIVFTGGGTLGHVMPNLYIMDELKDDFKCFYIGSNGIEKDTVKKVADYFEIPAIKLVRGKIIQNIKIPFVLIKSIFKAKKILKEIKPDVVFSKGGYVALPVCIASRMLKIPVITHESDYSLGLANKIILKVCNKMCVNFKNLERKSKKIIYTGPIFSKQYESNKKDFSNLKLDKEKPTMLIVGGSLGSKIINDNISAILKDLLKIFNIIHITGKGNNSIKSFENYNSFEMVDNMVNMYNIADFVLGRSGAGVTAESFFKQLPMLLIPLENKATRGDQTLNAEYYVKMGVAKIVKESDLKPTVLLKEIIEFYKHLKEYKSNYKTQKQANGKQKVIELINEYANKKES